MGIHCEINLHKPSSEAFMGTVGNIVSGSIKYAVDEETAFTRITVSLKGLGAICLEEYHVNGFGRRRRHFNTEKYIDIDKIIHNNEKGEIIPVGAYEIPFSFVIPQNVPPSVAYDKFGEKCRVVCCIKYYVRIKFNRRGIMNFTKRFKKPITMVSSILPKLPTTPIIYGGQKNLTQLLARNPSTVYIKADILNSILKSGDKIEFNYELTNNTKLTIKGVETKLVEVHNFFMKPAKPVVKEYDDVVGTDSKTCAVKSGETQEMSVEIKIPSDRKSADFSKIYSREYCVFITAHLPLPHRNYKLKIPIQIGSVVKETIVESFSNDNDDPPSYWESMNEYKSDNIELDELESFGNMSK